MDARRFLVALGIVVLALVGVGLAVVNLRGTVRTSIEPIEIDSTVESNVHERRSREAGRVRKDGSDRARSPARRRSGADPAPGSAPVPAGESEEDGEGGSGEQERVDDEGGRRD